MAVVILSISEADVTVAYWFGVIYDTVGVRCKHQSIVGRELRGELEGSSSRLFHGSERVISTDCLTTTAK